MELDVSIAAPQYGRVTRFFFIAPAMVGSACSVVTTELSARIAASHSKCLFLFTSSALQAGEFRVRKIEASLGNEVCLNTNFNVAFN